MITIVSLSMFLVFWEDAQLASMPHTVIPSGYARLIQGTLSLYYIRVAFLCTKYCVARLVVYLLVYFCFFWQDAELASMPPMLLSELVICFVN